MHQKVSGFVSTIVIIAALIGAGYWYRTASTLCRAPLSYRVGSLDRRFNLSEDEALEAVQEAENVWETAVGRDLFSYDPDAAFTMNFIFDERQKLTEEEGKLREVLDRKEDISSAIREQYDTLLAEYEELKRAYESRAATYDARLAEHNSEVAEWNGRGGAPKEIYERLNAEQTELDREHDSLRTLAGSLNRLVDQINALGERGNRTVRDYNEHVAEYNERFHHEREFTQGDYYAERVNIYQFKDRAELELVLAHELGHALALDHVDDPKAIMYYLMKEQGANLALADADLAELARICGE